VDCAKLPYLLRAGATMAQSSAIMNMTVSRFSGGKTDFNPVYELQATMGTLCNDLNDRAQVVTQAVANGISAKLHPGEIPPNIYNSDDAEWESYATSARASGPRLSPFAKSWNI
jgi:hypothetical protein